MAGLGCQPCWLVWEWECNGMLCWVWLCDCWYGHSNWHADRVCRSRDDEAGWRLLTLAIVCDRSCLPPAVKVPVALSCFFNHVESCKIIGAFLKCPLNYYLDIFLRKIVQQLQCKLLKCCPVQSLCDLFPENVTGANYFAMHHFAFHVPNSTSTASSPVKIQRCILLFQSTEKNSNPNRNWLLDP